MGITKILHISVSGVIGGLCGLLLGSFSESTNKDLIVRPCTPIFRTLSAAAPFKLSPLHTIENNARRTSEIMKHGFPSLDEVRSFDNFVLSYDRKTRVPHWVLEHLTADNLQKDESVDRTLCEFKPDESIHVFFRAENTDYIKSGYDRGHLAAAGNHKRNQRQCEQTFVLSNMAPQVGVGFNRDVWNVLERYVRRLTRTYRSVYCCTGPLYRPKVNSNGRKYVQYEVIGKNNVAVPTHFFKVLAMETADGQIEVEAYMLPNQVIDKTASLASFQVHPETIERSAGLLFFDNISKERIAKINGKQQ